MMKNTLWNRDGYEPEVWEQPEDRKSRRTLNNVSEMLDDVNRLSFRRIRESLDEYEGVRAW